MSAKESYCNTVAEEIDRNAVWPPGSPVKIGDYGLLEDKTFLRLGNIREFGIEWETESSSPFTFEFTSTGTAVALIGLNGEAKVAPLEASASAELRIKFERARSIYFRASKARSTEISNLASMATLLRQQERWNFGWVIVSKQTDADKLSVILSARANNEICVSGTASALRDFDSGKASANASISISGEAALKAIGVSGPFLVDLIRLRRLLGGVARGAQAGGIAVRPFEVVSARPNDAE